MAGLDRSDVSGEAEAGDHAESLGALWSRVRPAWTGPDWWDAQMRREVRALLWLAPGPRMLAALSVLGESARCPDPHAGEESVHLPRPGAGLGVPCACQVVVAAAWEAMAAWVAACGAGALVAAAGADELVVRVPAAGVTIRDPAREELAVALRVSPDSMGARLVLARELAAHPCLRELVESGGLSAWGARNVLVEVRGLPGEDARRVVEEAAGRVRDRWASGRRPWTTAEVGRAARAARRKLVPESGQAARQRAWRDRAVRVFLQEDGMATLHAILDATDAHRIHRRLTAIARGLDDPDRTMDQLRADVLVDVLLHQAPVGPAAPAAPAVAPDPAAPEPPFATQGPPTRPEIAVVVPLATLLGLATGGASVPGLGAIPDDVARALAAEGTWRAWVTDATTGQLVATGSRCYVPSAAVARLVRAREPHCRMPGCRRLAAGCDLDHATPWPAGATSPSNLGPLCRRHHIMKTHGDWALGVAAGIGDGETPGQPVGWSWRTPAGFTVRDESDPPVGC